MRVTDIECGSRPLKHDVTPELYLPVDKVQPIPLESLPPAILRRGMCAKSRGDLAACQTCTGGCAYGRTLMLMASGAIPTPQPKPRRQAEPPAEPPAPDNAPQERRSAAENPANQAALHNGILRAVALLRDLEHGADKEEAARNHGWENWTVARNYLSKRRAEIAAAKGESA